MHLHMWKIQGGIFCLLLEYLRRSGMYYSRYRASALTSLQVSKVPPQSPSSLPPRLTATLHPILSSSSCVVLVSISYLVLVWLSTSVLLSSPQISFRPRFLQHPLPFLSCSASGLSLSLDSKPEHLRPIFAASRLSSVVSSAPPPPFSSPPRNIPMGMALLFASKRQKCATSPET